MMIPTEGILLGGMAAAGFLFLAWSSAPRGTTGEVLAENGGPSIVEYQASWSVPLNLQGAGVVLSSPFIVRDRAYVGVAFPGLDPKGGNGGLYCVDLAKREIRWAFDDHGQMKPVFSSPYIADEHAYIGEGFHYHEKCKLYSINIANGQKVWEFTTSSQVESSPIVVDGTVIVGAGNDGVLALDAHTGKLKWRYGQAPGVSPIFRVGAPTAVDGNRLYVGSGVDRSYARELSETALVCVDVSSGKEIWKVPTQLPSWGAPVVAGEDVYFALGNGDVFYDAQGESPAGELLCLNTQTGRQRWRFQTPNGILSAPVVDSRFVFFTCRDGFCYCLGRFDGELRWKRDMGSPVVASPALNIGKVSTLSANHVFVVSTQGRIACLDAATGTILWSRHDLEPMAAHCVSTPAVVCLPTPEGLRRQIIFGAGLHNLTLPVLYCVEDIVRVAESEKPES